jgi:hypothetical protein
MTSTHIQRRRTAAARIAIGLIAVLALAGALTACGGSGSNPTTSASLAELGAAKRAGEEKARERDRVKNLQKQMRALKRQVKRRKSSPASAVASSPAAAPAAAPPAIEEPVRAFHAPSGNVSCQVLTDGASCTVESIGETFVFEAGQPARIESGAALPRYLGELVGYGSTVSSGSVSCEVPPSDVPRGISCSDSSSGHGFEASRIPSRQSAY